MRPAPLAGLALALLAASTRGSAADLLDVPGLELRFDNTLRYNLGVRTDPVDPKLGANPVFTAGENSVRRGGITTNRLDLLSELDLSYEGRYGARVSAAAWYDQAYQHGTTTRSAAVATPGTYVGGDLSDYTLRRYRGPWGELLDAFAFARLHAGSVPVTVKAGRHAVYWGESLMQAGAIHGVSYSQTPLDLQKGSATPGVEAKELFRPLASVSAQAQLTATVSLAAQYFLEWQPFVYPEGGTFLAGADFAFNGPDRVFRPPPPPGGTFLDNGGASEPRETGGAARRGSRRPGAPRVPAVLRRGRRPRRRQPGEAAPRRERGRRGVVAPQRAAPRAAARARGAAARRAAGSPPLPERPARAEGELVPGARRHRARRR
jgi:hypothetical protein